MLNQIQRLFTPSGKAVTAEATKSTQPKTVIAIAGGKGGYILEEDLKKVRGDFDQQFAAQPYLNGYWRAGIFTCVKPPKIAAAVVATVLDRASGLTKILPTEAREQLEALRAEFKRLNEELERHNFSATRTIFLQQRSASAVKSGEINLSAFASEGQIEGQISAARDAIHARIKELCGETFKVLEPACIRARDAARDIVVSMDSDERAEATKFGVPYVPSQQLRAFVHFAVVKATQPVANYTAGSGWLSPDTDLESTWLSGAVGPAAGQPIPAMGLKLTAEGYKPRTPEDVYGDRFGFVTPSAEEKRAHERKVEELNAFNDAIRNQPIK